MVREKPLLPLLFYPKYLVAKSLSMPTRSLRGYHLSSQRVSPYKQVELCSLVCWLDSPNIAKERVAQRVAEGGHNIPLETIERRYYNGIANLFTIYIDMVDICYIFDNSQGERTPIAKKYKGEKEIIYNTDLYNQMKNSYEKGRN